MGAALRAFGTKRQYEFTGYVREFMPAFQTFSVLNFCQHSFLFYRLSQSSATIRQREKIIHPDAHDNSESNEKNQSISAHRVSEPR